VVQAFDEARKKTLLVIARNEVRTNDIRNLLAGEDLEIVTVADLPSANKSSTPRPGGWHRARLGSPDSAGIESSSRCSQVVVASSADCGLGTSGLGGATGV